MITLFTLPKPFLGHIGMIQRNAIQAGRVCIPISTSSYSAMSKAPRRSQPSSESGTFRMWT